jgi:hypothetical protein
MFVFVSVALAKRLSELRAKCASQATALSDGYHVIDIPQITGLAAASSYASVLLFALYIKSAEAVDSERRLPGVRSRFSVR